MPKNMLLNPKIERFEGLDARSREIMERTVAFFEKKGKEELKTHDRDGTWYRDFLEWNKEVGAFATLLTPPEHAIDDPDELRTVELHLTGCAECRAEVDAHRSVTAAMAEAELHAPPGLWARIEDGLEPEKPEPVVKWWQMQNVISIAAVTAVAAAIGLVIDDAIVVVEAIYSRVAAGLPRARAVEAHRRAERPGHRHAGRHAAGRRARALRGDQRPAVGLPARPRGSGPAGRSPRQLRQARAHPQPGAHEHRGGHVPGATLLPLRLLLDAAPRLFAIGCFCIGTNQVNLGAAAKAGVPVFNAPFSNTRSVAELALAEGIMLMRGIPKRNAAAHRGEWIKSAAQSHEIRGKTLGIVGLGRIGKLL